MWLRTVCDVGVVSDAFCGTFVWGLDASVADGWHIIQTVGKSSLNCCRTFKLTISSFSYETARPVDRQFMALSMKTKSNVQVLRSNG